MHHFGERRWSIGIVDDIRSVNDQNTRIVGDFTKSCRTSKIVERMYGLVSTDKDWSLHFHRVVGGSGFTELNSMDPVFPKIIDACGWLAGHSGRFTRRTLQTRFFETGDNFYLGMELPRELDQWKRDLVNQLVGILEHKELVKDRIDEFEALKKALMYSLDRLWYFACLEVIRTGDVYNPGARKRVPHLYTIDSSIPKNVGHLDVGESFRILDTSDEKYEILAKKFTYVLIRNVEGYVFTLPRSVKVKRESNLTRCPDGNKESKVVRTCDLFPVYS